LGNPFAGTHKLGRLFPSEAGTLDVLTDQVGESRLMAGIHLRTDLDVGKALGQRVAGVVWARGG